MRRCVDVLALLLSYPFIALAAPQTECPKVVYLTFDTGHMGVASLVANVLNRQDVRVTFFLADEMTLDGGTSLDDRWAPWWRARVAEGHAFGAHTFEHARWVADAGPGRFHVRIGQAGPGSTRTTWTGAQYCDSLERVERRFLFMTGQRMTRLFRAPGGRTSPALVATARHCGWAHVGWSDAGFLGDELPSTRYTNRMLLDQALQRIRSGDILLAHLGIWSRQDPWAPAVLEPLIMGLKARGFCFRTMRDHPDYRDRRVTE